MASWHFPKTISEQRKQSKTSGQNPNIKTLPTKKKWRNCISKHTVLSSFLRKAQVSAAGLFWYISFFVYCLAAPCGVLSRRLGTANLTDVKAEITESEDVWTSAFERTDFKKWANSWNFLPINNKKPNVICQSFVSLLPTHVCLIKFSPNYNVSPWNLKGRNIWYKQVFSWRINVL